MTAGKIRITLIIAVFVIVMSMGMAVSAHAVSVNTSPVTLYACLEDDFPDLSIPDNFPQEYQIRVTGAKGTPAYRVIDGNLTVTKDGLVRPRLYTWYKGKDGCYSETYEEGAPYYRYFVYGDAVVRVSVDGKSFEIPFHVKNYAEYLAEQVMDDYVKKNISSDMTDLEKMDKITAFPAQYDYVYANSNYAGLIIGEGGNCVASSDAIMYLCKKAGVQARIRNGSFDSGAIGNHTNVAAYSGGKTYVLEAGYGENAPRYYEVRELKGGFTYRYIHGQPMTLKIVQYDGLDENIVVPAEIDGYKVSALGEEFLARCENVKSVTIGPDISNIEDGALMDCGFKLSNIRVSSDNPNYSSYNGVLFDKNRKTLIYFPRGKRGGEYEIPEGVEKIASNAFNELRWDNHDFRWRTSPSESITLPKSLKVVETDAFYGDMVKKIIFKGNCPDFREDSLKGLLDGASIYFPCNNRTWEKSAYSKLSGEVYWKKCHSGSKTVNTPATFSSDGNVKEICTSCGETVKTVEKIAKLESSRLSARKYAYNGKSHKPGVTIKNAKGQVIDKSHYKVSYKNSVKIGKATVTITFDGKKYKGTRVISYRVVPKKPVISKTAAKKGKLTVTAASAVSKTGGTKYRIAYRVKGTSKWKYISTTKKVKTITGLKKGKKYQIKMAAVKTVNKKKYQSSWTKIRTTGKIK